MLTATTTELARRIRGHVLRMTNAGRSSHVGSALSIADVMAVLYGGVLRHDPSAPEWPDRDRFILSKGHAGVAGVELSTGSLGHGLPVGAGMALQSRRRGWPYRVFVAMGDGECAEGSVWEAALFAAHHRLAGLVAVVDANRLQGLGSTDEVLRVDPLAAKWEAFGWSTVVVDGHDHDALRAALDVDPGDGSDDRPRCVLAQTVKGKGVSFMENELAWHYKSPSDADLVSALTELGLEP